jgi:restriction system protein
MERDMRAQQRAVATATREAERARKALERAEAWEQKEQKRLYLEARQAEVDAMNGELESEVAELETLLAATLDVDDYLDFETLKVEPEIPPFQPGSLDIREAQPTRDSFLPEPLSGVAKFVPGAKARHELAVAEGETRYAAAVAEHGERGPTTTKMSRRCAPRRPRRTKRSMTFGGVSTHLTPRRSLNTSH